MDVPSGSGPRIRAGLFEIDMDSLELLKPATIAALANKTGNPQALSWGRYLL